MGSFELNPPFTIRSTAVEDHVVELLQAAERDGKALSFCYVVPETAGRLQTRKSIRRETPFLAGELMAGFLKVQRRHGPGPRLPTRQRVPDPRQAALGLPLHDGHHLVPDDGRQR